MTLHMAKLRPGPTNEIIDETASPQQIQQQLDSKGCQNTFGTVEKTMCLTVAIVSVRNSRLAVEKLLGSISMDDSDQFSDNSPNRDNYKFRLSVLDRKHFPNSSVVDSDAGGLLATAIHLERRQASRGQRVQHPRSGFAVHAPGFMPGVLTTLSREMVTIPRVWLGRRSSNSRSNFDQRA